MKLDNHSPKLKTEIQIQKRQEKEKFLFDGVLTPKPNQRVFELDIEKMVVTEAKYFTETDTVSYSDIINNTKSQITRKILVKDGFDYVIKLNMENALKHFRKVWNNPDIDRSDNSDYNVLAKNQRKVAKFKNK